MFTAALFIIVPHLVYIMAGRIPVGLVQQRENESENKTSCMRLITPIKKVSFLLKEN